jgi:hypothetical protein
MKNKTVGILVIAIALLIGFIIFWFNKALSEIVNTSCTHGPSCPMWGTIDFQTKTSLGIMGFVVLIGLYLVFFVKEEKAKTEQVSEKKISKENYEKIMCKLNADEKIVLEKIIESQGTIFQSDLVEKTSFTKVKMTRILDRLEGKALIERKRRGMTNVVILKH